MSSADDDQFRRRMIGLDERVHFSTA
jgi:hypothetical protein